MAKVACPIENCPRELSRRGLHGHIEHSHDVPHSEALELAKEAKAQAQVRELEADDASSEGEDGASDVEIDPGVDDEVDRAIAELIRRRTQREKLRTVDQLSAEDPPEPASPFEQVDEVVGLVERVQSITSPPQALADGAGPATERDVLAALASNDVDPETAREIASELGGHKGPVDRLVDELLANTAISTVSQAVGEVGADQLAAWMSRRLEGRRRRERETGRRREPREQHEARGAGAEPRLSERAARAAAEVEAEPAEAAEPVDESPNKRRRREDEAEEDDDDE